MSRTRSVHARWLSAVIVAIVAAMVFPVASQAYIDPPVKLGAEYANLDETAGLLLENSPREISGIEQSSTTEALYEEQLAVSSDFDAAAAAELNTEVESLLVETSVWDWTLAAPLAVAVSGGWVGWQIGSTIWGTFFEEPSGEAGEEPGVTVYPVDTWTPRSQGSVILSDGTGDAYAPAWGFEGTSSIAGAPGRVTDTGACEAELLGDGSPIFAPGWNSASFCGISKYRSYVLWKAATPQRCGAVSSCPEVQTSPYGGAYQGVGPSAEDLRTSIVAKLNTETYPVLNAFLNHEKQPENYPDPRITKEEEDHRCDRTPGASFMNSGGNKAPEPFSKFYGEPFEVTVRPEGFESTDVYLHYGTTFWKPGGNPEITPRYVDAWGGWGYRHIKAKHGWSAQDRVETEAALAGDPSPDFNEISGNYVYEIPDLLKGVGGSECIRAVAVDFNAGLGDPRPRGIVSSFNKVVP